MKLKLSGLLILLLAVLLMFSSVLTSCADTKNVSNDTKVTEGTESTTQAPIETENLYDSNGYLNDSIPDDVDLRGEKVTILYWDNAKNLEFEVEGINGSIINDSLYKRNTIVEDRLNITFEWIGENGDYAQRTDFNKIIAADIAGSCEYDIISAYSTTIAMATTNGYALNLLDYDEQIDFAKPWWASDLTDMATINNKLYFATGDISTNYLLRMYGTFFNKSIIEDLNLKSPYDYVKENNWTIDSFITVATDSATNLNGTDIYGFVNDSITIEALFYGAGLYFVDKDQSDEPFLSDAWRNDKAETFIDKVAAFCSSEATLLSGKDETTFTDENSTFLVYSLDFAMNYLADVDINFGIVPIPKYDADQSQYETTLNYKYSLYMISTGSAIPEDAAYTLEAMASQSYRTVTPELYENVMKVRYCTDQTSQIMIDYIRDGVSFEIGRTFTHSFNYDTYRSIRAALVGSSEVGWQTTASSFKTVFETQLQTLLTVFKD